MRSKMRREIAARTGTSNRRAVILEEYGFTVEFYEDGVLVETRPLPKKSIHYAEDCAENWVSGLMQIK